MNQEPSYWFSVPHHPNVFRDLWGHDPPCRAAPVATPLPPSVRMYMSSTPSIRSCYFMSANTSVVNAMFCQWFRNRCSWTMCWVTPTWEPARPRATRCQLDPPEDTRLAAPCHFADRPTDRPTTRHGQSRSLIRHGTIDSVVGSTRHLRELKGWRFPFNGTPDIRDLKTSKVGCHH